jgi:hypothetical protein
LHYVKYFLDWASGIKKSVNHSFLIARFNWLQKIDRYKWRFLRRLFTATKATERLKRKSLEDFYF